MCNAIGGNISRLFADDTGLFTHGKNIDELINASKEKYRLLFKWCLDNRLTINYSKTCFIVFHTRNKKIPHNLKEIKIDDVTITRVKETKYLGLHYDEHLTWNEHVTYLCQKLVKFFGIFKKIRQCITLKIARQLYFSFIYSRINYGLQIYGSCSKALMSKIQTLSNRLLKFLLKLDIRTPTIVLHKKLNVLKITDNFEVNMLNFVRDCLYGDCPDLFKNYFVFSNHGHSVRIPKLYVHPHRTVFASLSVKIKGAQLWNNLPMHIKAKSNLKSFKKIVRCYYSSRY